MNNDKNKNVRYIGVIVAVTGLILTLISIVWAMGGQHNRIESACVKVDKLSPRVNENEKSIAVIETKLDNIVTGQIEIKELIKKKQ